MPTDTPDPETLRLREDDTRKKNWKRWGPYLAERQWGTVREDYSADGDCWNFFTHDQARSRAYRWGEDGLLGITDRECRLCFAIALWNGNDPILKERLFGLTNPQGNHGEDVKECYYYIDSTPTHSYMKGLYKYPQASFPYQELIDQNHRRGKMDREFELTDTGIFDQNRYFDVQAEYAKNAPDDILIRITVSNRGPDRATLHLLPTLWFRNGWSWGSPPEGADPRPSLSQSGPTSIIAEHCSLKRFQLDAEPSGATAPEWLFTENETNLAKCFNAGNQGRFFKDAFHRYLIEGVRDCTNPANIGTKATAHYKFDLAAGAEVCVRLRLRESAATSIAPFGEEFSRIFNQRIADADVFYRRHLPPSLSPDVLQVARQAYGGLFWSKQFYYYIVKQWLEGDPNQPKPPPGRAQGATAIGNISTRATC